MGGTEQAITSVGGGGGPSSLLSSSSPFLVEETGVEGSESGTGLNDNVGKKPGTSHQMGLWSLTQESNQWEFDSH